jgi:hypothetical protein
LRWNLPASATVEAASAVESNAHVTSAMEATANRSVSDYAAMNEVAAPDEGGSASNKAGPEARATVKARAPIKTVKPRASTDEDTAGEPTGTVVAVRRARVRVISIVAVGAHRGWTNVSWADSNADHNSLCVCERCRNQARAN